MQKVVAAVRHSTVSPGVPLDGELWTSPILTGEAGGAERGLVDDHRVVVVEDPTAEGRDERVAGVIDGRRRVHQEVDAVDRAVAGVAEALEGRAEGRAGRPPRLSAL